MAVPVHHRHRVSLFDAHLLKGIGQPLDALIQLHIGIGHFVAIDDFAIRVIGKGRTQDVFDQQGETIGGRGLRYESDGHGIPPLSETVNGWLGLLGVYNTNYFKY